MRRILLGLACASALMAAGAAKADDDIFVLRLGAAQLDTDTTVTADGSVAGTPFSFEDEFQLADDETVPRVEGLFRFAPRNRLVFNYLRFDRDESASLDEDLQFGDVLFPSGSSVTAESQLDLGSLMYEFAVVDTETVTFGLQVGGYWAEAEASARAQVGDTVEKATAKEDGTAPAVGLRLMASPNEHWRFGVQGQYFDAEWGDFDDDVTGELSRVNALVEYRFTPNFGIFAGYDWFKLELRDKNVSEVDAGLDLEFKGPMAGVTLAF